MWLLYKGNIHIRKGFEGLGPGAGKWDYLGRKFACISERFQCAAERLSL